MDVVFVELTMPFTKKATTATIRRHATPSVTTISNIVNAMRGPSGARPFSFASEGFRGALTVWI
jgi:hypothetical protein